MKKFLLCLCLFAAAAGAFAEGWAYRGPKNRVVTLILTANYKSPRLIAELAQVENRQPYLLVPVSGEGSLFFCPGNSRKRAIEVREEDVERFIRFLNPRQIIVLGDEEYVPQRYYEGLDRHIPVVRVAPGDWKLAAASIERLLGLSHLNRDYDKLAPKLATGTLYAPAAKPLAPEFVHSEVTDEPVATPVEEPAAPAANQPAKGEVKAEAWTPDPKIETPAPEPALQSPEAKPAEVKKADAIQKPPVEVKKTAPAKPVQAPETVGAKKPAAQSGAAIRPEMLD